MRLAGVTQVQVNPRTGLTFPVVLRALMRQDPNVIMVGEMRDRETAAVAISAALAGQTVFTTLHANDAPRTIERLIELGTPRQALASALTAIVAQRLVRTLCERCRAREAVPDEMRAALRWPRWQRRRHQHRSAPLKELPHPAPCGTSVPRHPGYAKSE